MLFRSPWVARATALLAFPRASDFSAFQLCCPSNLLSNSAPGQGAASSVGSAVSRHAGEGCRWYLISCDYFKTDFINLPISAGLRVTLIPHSSITSSLL